MAETFREIGTPESRASQSTPKRAFDQGFDGNGGTVPTVREARLDDSADGVCKAAGTRLRAGAGFSGLVGPTFWDRALETPQWINRDYAAPSSNLSRSYSADKSKELVRPPLHAGILLGAGRSRLKNRFSRQLLRLEIRATRQSRPSLRAPTTTEIAKKKLAQTAHKRDASGGLFRGSRLLSKATYGEDRCGADAARQRAQHRPGGLHSGGVPTWLRLRSEGR
jgi:hypothetical protein